MPVDVSFLVTGGAWLPPPGRSAPAADELPPGTRLGPFCLVRRIGSGGSGTVYLATRAEGFAQSVAVKVLRTGMDERLAERFRRERDFLSALEHPGIARIIDGGETPDGLPWSAMEYVDGLPLDAWCMRAGLDWRARLALLARVCDAVQFAHTQLVVHGDLKPHNILVDAKGTPRLLDFGIATRSGDSEPVRAFTPGYASPEQIAGSRLTAASDVYQLGCLLGDLVADLALPALARRNVAALIERATALEPAQRYASATELGAELERVVAGHCTRARRWPPWIRALFFARLRWRPLALGSLALAGLVALDVHYTQRLRAERDRAENESQAARATSRFLGGLLRMAAPADATATTLSGLVDQGARQLVGAAPKQADRAVLAVTLGEAYLDLGKPARAAELLDRVGDVAAAGAPIAVRAKLAALRARLAAGTNDAAGAQRALAQAAALQAQLRPEEAAALALHRATTQAQLLLASGRVKDGIAVLDVALSTHPATGTEAAEALRQLAQLYEREHDEERAVACLQRSIALLADVLGAEAPATLSAQRRLAFHFAVRGRPQDAAQLLAQQEDLVLARFGAGSLEYADLIGMRGVLAGIAGDTAAGAEQFRRRLALLAANGLGESLQVAKTRLNLGNVLVDAGDVRGSIVQYREALRLWQLLAPASDPDLLGAQAELSNALCQAGEWTESQQLYEDAMRVHAAQDFQPVAEVAATMREHAQCLAAHGRPELARASLRLDAPHWAQLPQQAQEKLAPLYATLGMTPPH